MNLHAIGLGLVLFVTCGCRTTSPVSSAKNTQRTTNTGIVAEAVLDFDVSKLKAHLANAQSGHLQDKVLWAMFLEEQKGDTPCPGKAQEAYYLINAGNDPAEDVYEVIAKPMPMNGPCGLALSDDVKPTTQVSRTLMESSPLAEIGTFDKIKLSIKEAVIKAESHYKNFKYRDGVKIYRHLHPTTWDYPWYAIYGVWCDLESTAYINAMTGEVLEMMDSPSEGACPQK